ncbi:serine/threonine protein kinase [Azonexus sp.]|uniref:serine/threonine protein kinase n=1 Tax=Azonexus sp. TaxID=1872668 RepID=UPI0039E2B447
MSQQIRRCPTCAEENPPEQMRCTCGALLFGIDLSPPAAPRPEPPSTDSAVPAAADTAASAVPDKLRCPHADCAQENPPDSLRCLYCDRPLTSKDATEENADTPRTGGLSGPQPGTPTLINLPSALRTRYRILRALPAAGSEAELLIVVPQTPEPDNAANEYVAKIYRHGIHPDAEVQARIAAIDPQHCVRLIERGLSDGFAFELMEYCRAGSLRDWLRDHAPLNPVQWRGCLQELSAALSAVHAEQLIHRDLKPENVLLRSAAPLDLVLTDFSGASLTNATLHFTGMARTLSYSAPEALSGVLDAKADWWALGMILLEAALGRHPFAGLSDAVMLHHLTTRSIDLSAISDPAQHMLLRGLLLRDPKARWGENEIKRWLAGEQNLTLARDEHAPAAIRPYQIGEALCHTPEQLGAALARHWDKARADLDNGLLMHWLRNDLQDMNRVRFLIDLNFDSGLPPDRRLLRFILDLAPGLPPVWRGQRIGLRELLGIVDHALKNDDPALDFLLDLAQQRVLDIYAAAGNAEMTDIASRWRSAEESFNRVWQSTLSALKAQRPAGENPDFHELMFGQGGPKHPGARTLHPRLLALAYDEGWREKLRQHLAQQLASLRPHCPWLPTPEVLAHAAAGDLLVFEALLPEAQRQAKKNLSRQENAARERQETTQRLQRETRQAAAYLALFGQKGLWRQNTLDELDSALDQLAAVTAQVRAHDDSSPAYQNLRAEVLRLEPITKRIRPLLEENYQQRMIRRGWFNERSLRFYGIALFATPIFLGPRFFFPILLGGGGIVLWRFGVEFLVLKRIKDWLEKLPVN